MTVAALVVGFTGTASTQSAEEVLVNGHRARAREVIVRYKAAPSVETLSNHATQTDATDQKKINRHDTWRVKSASRTVEDMMGTLTGDPEVEYVEPNYIVEADADPNDPLFANQWALKNVGQTVNDTTTGTEGADIGATLAWGVSTGSRSVVVAVLDSGIDASHFDLAGNVWSAPAAFTVTIGGASLTCPAGTQGFDAISFTCQAPDTFSHGTHVSGIIGAVGNNTVGVAGVNQLVTIMPLRILDNQGRGTVADAIEAIEFAIQAKTAFAATGGANVRILNNSWGSTSYSQALYDQIVKAQAYDMLFVASAGNSGTNTDVMAYYPSGYAVPNVLSVGASDAMDLVPLFSNYGTSKVHLSAPGVDILSTAPGGSFLFKTGTSQAAAFVSGAAALVLSKCTTLDTAGLRNNLLGGVDVKVGLGGTSQTGGRLNVNTSIRACSTKPSTPTGLTAMAGSGQVLLNWTATPGAASYVVKMATRSTGTYTVIASGLTSATYTKTGLTNGTSYYFKVASVNPAGTSADSAYVLGKPALPPTPTGLTAASGISKVTLTWNASAGAISYVVKQSATSSGTYTPVASDVTATSMTVTGLTNGSTYYFKVTAVTPLGNSADTASVTGKPVACPSPSGLAAGGGVSQVALTWTPAEAATSYVVKRATSATGAYTVIGSGLTGTSFTATGLTNGTSYYFKVAAVSALGTSADSAYALGKPLAPPTAPASPKATAGTGQITVAWSSATGAAGYNVYRSTTAGGPYTFIGTTTSRTYYDKGLAKGAKFYYVVTAYNVNKTEGPSSLQVSATVN